MFGKLRDEEHNYWISYTDLVMGFLIVFIVIALVLYNRDVEKVKLEGKYQELESTFRDQFAALEGIEVTDDATIRFVLDESKEESLFEFADYHPTPYLESLLKTFIPVYFDEIFEIYQQQGDSSATGKLRIKELRIEGHTDSEGTYDDNLHFSSGRAVKVQSLILRDEYFTTYAEGFQEFVKENTIACGYSFSHLLDSNGALVSISGQEEDKDKSRRVEFRVLLEYQP